MMRGLGGIAVVGGLVALAWAAFGGAGNSLDEDDIMRLAYLGVLASFVGATLFTGGWHSVGADLRALAFWLGALIIVAGLYGFRDDLKAFGLRLAGGIVPGLAVEQGEELVFSRGRNGMFIVNGEVNGARIRFLFDTGASGISLTAEDARRAGLAPLESDYSLQTSTANGIAKVAPVKLARLAVGPIALSNLNATVSRPGALTTSLLGHGFLNQLGSYEVRGDRLILRPQ